MSYFISPLTLFTISLYPIGFLTITAHWKRGKQEFLVIIWIALSLNTSYMIKQCDSIQRKLSRKEKGWDNRNTCSIRIL